MKGRVTLHQYYDWTWVAVLFLLWGLGLSSGTVHWLFALAVVALIGLQLSRVGQNRLLRVWLPVGVFSLGAVVGLWQYQQSKDIALVFSSVLFGLLPVWFPKRGRRAGYWALVVLVVVGGLVNLLAGDSPGEFLLFILLASALVLSLNAAHLFFYVGAAQSDLRRVPKRYFLPFLSSVGMGLLVGGALFVFFPRTLQWNNPLGMRSKSSTTGYSGRVTLNAAAIAESQAVAMQIESNDPGWLRARAPFLLVRGNTLEHFDGVRWSSKAAFAKRRLMHPGELLHSNAFERRMIRLRIYREPSESDAVFLTGVVHDAVFPPELGTLLLDGNGSVSRRTPNSGHYAYNLNISPTRRPEALDTMSLRGFKWELRNPRESNFAGADRSDDMARFLEVDPAVSEAAFFRSWSGELLAQVPKEPKLGWLFSRLAGHFRQEFEVGYQAGARGVDSLEAFLSKVRYGHCEYFATAAALFLRTQGIPSRLVLGYRGGTFNELSKVLEVREANAHAWVEAFLPATGWVAFDPTPLVVRPKPQSWLAEVSVYIAALRFWAQRYIVDYNVQTQMSLFQNLKRQAMGPTPQSGWESPSWQRMGRLKWFLVALLFVGGWMFRRRWSRERRRSSTRLPVFYRQFQKVARARGWVRAPGESFACFHARLGVDPVLGKVSPEFASAIEQELYAPRRHQHSADHASLQRRLRTSLREARSGRH